MEKFIKINILMILFLISFSVFAVSRPNVIPNTGSPAPNQNNILTTPPPTPPNYIPPAAASGPTPIPATGPNNTSTPSDIRQSVNPSTALSDADISTNVQAKIMGDSTLIGANIRVRTVDGVVNLEGTATTQDQINSATQFAESVSGVKRVESHVTIQASPTTPGETIPPH